ncbi:hypothetical protein [Spirosoma agri]|uniref:DUF3352 domain-containing protein n=1 Tax=Spirosoma agri TaxID=1987381 RepID=A0A6M0IH27_9BACT|nr:hypothetical protein [Spirosoma agri]NEU66995.1 hypothetical protein [Spirosoma agri]
MSDKRIWIGLGAVLLVLGGWFGYRQVYPSNRTIWSLMPAGSLLVLASDHLQDTVSAQALRNQIALQQLPIFDEARQRLDRFLFAATDSVAAIEFAKGKNIRYSLHSISRTTLDFILYIPIAEADQPFLNRLTNPNPRQFRILRHTFSGEKILDLVSRSNEPVLSFIITDGFLVGSSSGILIENVAKRMHQTLTLPRSEPDFRVDRDHLAVLSVRPQILQSLFGSAGSLIRLFLPEELNLQFRQPASQSHLIGYAADEIGARQDVASLFTDQTPRRIQSPELIPQTTATLYHIGISNASDFGRSLRKLLRSASSDFLRERYDQIESATEPLYQSLGSDILLCRMESPSGARQQVMVLNATNVKALSNAYQQAAYLAGARNLAAPKTFLGHKTLLLDVPELPASLFSSLFTGFQRSWITQHGSSLIIANAEEAMQEYLQQLQRKAVWSTDPRQADLLKNTLRPANFTAFVRLNRVNTDQSQTLLTSTWPLAWQNLLDDPARTDHSSGLAGLDNIAYQASYGNEKILSTLVLGRTARRASKAVLNRLLLQKKIEFTAPLLSAPVVTGSLSDGAPQFYAQAGQFVLVTPEGDRIPQQALDGPIRSNTLAVDFLDNGNLQYLFMTDQTLYVTDPRKRSAKLTAIRLPAGIDPTYLTRPRGSLQRNWVALVAHQDGAVYALDRQRKAFVRIMAAQRKSPLLLPFQVIATRAGMEILATQADGILNRWRENGTQFPRFPIQVKRATEDELDVRFAGPALLPFGQSTIQTITEEGQLLTLNTNGVVTHKTQLYRPVRSGVFRLFPDEAQTNWLLLRSSDTEATVLDQQGQRRFDIRALQPGRSNIRYYRLGAGIELISVKSGGFTTLYDLNGRIIGDRPIPSDHLVSLQFDERTNELYILSGAKQTVQLFSIRLR